MYCLQEESTMEVVIKICFQDESFAYLQEDRRKGWIASGKKRRNAFVFWNAKNAGEAIEEFLRRSGQAYIDTIAHIELHKPLK